MLIALTADLLQKVAPPIAAVPFAWLESGALVADTGGPLRAGVDPVAPAVVCVQGTSISTLSRIYSQPAEGAFVIAEVKADSEVYLTAREQKR